MSKICRHIPNIMHQMNQHHQVSPSKTSIVIVFLEEATSKALNRKSDNASSITGATCVLPKFKKTGTKICACIFKKSVVLVADTRSTNSEVVAKKIFENIHYLTVIFDVVVHVQQLMQQRRQN